jgi:hypothetical protein
MPDPAAIVLTLSMSPKILKSMAASFQAQAVLVNPKNLAKGARNAEFGVALQLRP